MHKTVCNRNCCTHVCRHAYAPCTVVCLLSVVTEAITSLRVRVNTACCTIILLLYWYCTVVQPNKHFTALQPHKTLLAVCARTKKGTQPPVSTISRRFFAPHSFPRDSNVSAAVRSWPSLELDAGTVVVVVVCAHRLN